MEAIWIYSTLQPQWHRAIMINVYLCMCVCIYECTHACSLLLLDEWTNLDETLYWNCLGHRECQHLYSLYKNSIQISQSYIFVNLTVQLSSQLNVIVENKIGVLYYNISDNHTIMIVVYCMCIHMFPQQFFRKTLLPLHFRQYSQTKYCIITFQLGLEYVLKWVIFQRSWGD